MTRYLFFSALFFTFIANNGCSNKKHDQAATLPTPASDTSNTAAGKTLPATNPVKDPASFIPKGYVLFEKITGDLNKDGLPDCVLIIKATDPAKLVKDEYRGELDRNRRGIVILFNKNNGYELAEKNYDCFSSENEDGGVYFAPELSATISKGNLYLSYGHGRYGDWSYTFRFNNTGFELIGYDASHNNGPVINRQTSINFLTGKKQEKVNTNENADSGEEVFKETRTGIPVKALIKLADIKDFEELDRHEW